MEDWRELHLEDLPRSLRTVAQLIGLEYAAALLRRFAGSRVRVPRHARPDHPLLALLGAEGMRRFCQMFGGEVLEVPRAEGVRRRMRDREIARLYDGGTPVRLLARAYGLTERRIYHILNSVDSLRESGKNPPQPLFPHDGGWEEAGSAHPW